MSSDDLLAFLQTQGYQNLRLLDDGTIGGMLQLLYTKAIVLGLERGGWEYRYCFEEAARADLEFAKLKAVDEEPSGWVARRYAERQATIGRGCLSYWARKYQLDTVCRLGGLSGLTRSFFKRPVGVITCARTNNC